MCCHAQCHAYTWYCYFSDEDKSKPGKEAQPPEEPSEGQRRRVDILLSELVKKFPPKAFTGKVGH